MIMSLYGMVWYGMVGNEDLSVNHQEIKWTISIHRFAKALKRSESFRRGAQVAPAPANERNKVGFWNLARSIYALDCGAFLLTLVSLLCFTAYWLIVDPDGVFLFSTVHYLNSFLIFVVSCYFMLRKFGHWAKIINSFRQYLASPEIVNWFVNFCDCPVFWKCPVSSFPHLHRI